MGQYIKNVVSLWLYLYTLLLSWLHVIFHLFIFIPRWSSISLRVRQPTMLLEKLLVHVLLSSALRYTVNTMNLHVQ